jgi:AbrB family looped-hinge helix DNA binding protein
MKSHNHSSQHHYPGMPRFLLFDKETKKYRMNPVEQRAKDLSDIFMSEEPKITIEDPNCIDGIPVAKVSITGQIDVPSKIKQRLGVNPGDVVAFVESGNGVELRKARLLLDFT